MTDILGGLLKDTCVYWPPGSLDKFGRRTPGTAVELKCRMSRKSKSVTTANGKELNVDATVYLDTAIEIDGYIWEGLLVDKPSTPPDENRIKGVDKTDDVDQTETVYKAYI